MFQKRKKNPSFELKRPKITGSKKINPYSENMRKIFGESRLTPDSLHELILSGSGSLTVLHRDAPKYQGGAELNK